MLHQLWSTGWNHEQELTNWAVSYTRWRRRKEGNVLFNAALNTFYLRLYGVRHILKDHSDSARGNPLPPHGLLCPISSKGSFICIIPQTRWHIHTTAFVPTSRWALAGAKNSSIGPPHEGSIRRSVAPWALVGTRNSSMGPPWRIDPTIDITVSERSYHGSASRSFHERRRRKTTSTTTNHNSLRGWRCRPRTRWSSVEGPPSTTACRPSASRYTTGLLWHWLGFRPRLLLPTYCWSSWWVSSAPNCSDVLLVKAGHDDDHDDDDDDDVDDI